MGKFSRLAGAILLCGFGMAVVTAVALFGLENLTAPGWTAKEAPTELDDFQPLATRSVVYARDGSILRLLHAEQNRAPVSLNYVPPHVVRAVLDAEDDRFYQHGAIDLRALGRALAVNVESGSVSEGGSTITQQLVKVSLLGSKQNLKRKVQEVALAIRLESSSTKDEILERYLNTVYFGNGAYGLQAAAERYFNTDVDKLTVGQGVLLASMIRNPVYADPYVDGGVRAVERRSAVVDRMRELGHLSSEEAEQIKVEPLPAPPPAQPPTGSDYFITEVTQQLLRDPRLGATDQEREYAVFNGGLAIHTTLDPAWQRMAEDAVKSKVPDTKGQFNAALVSVEPGTGAVRTLVGGADFAQQKFNLATQKGRPTGSSFKVFTLIAALEAGYSPMDTISGSSPCSIPNPGGIPNPWRPENVEGSAGGTLSLTDATALSVNCAYARLVKQVGPEKVAEVAHRMGITNELPPNLSITLGVNDVSPLQMAGAYATLASDGVHHPPYFIDRVEDREGKLLFGTKKDPVEAIAPRFARTVNQMLTQVVQSGTARAAALPNWPVAGKTGTSEENKNAWFVGYTPTLATAIWMGNPDAEIPMYNVGGIRVYGGTYPARIWNAYMSEVVRGVPPVGFPAPDDPITGSQYRGGNDEQFVQNAQGEDDVAVQEDFDSFAAADPQPEVRIDRPPPQVEIPPIPRPVAPRVPAVPDPDDFNPYVRDRPHRPRD